MNENYKAIIIGTSLTGKTTLIRHLRKTTNIHVREIDEELVELNNGTYPTDSDYKNNVLSPQIKKDLLEKKSILFFTNAHYFTDKDLEIARTEGFKIIQLFVNKDELQIRNKHRMETEGYEDHSQWFDSMLQYQKDILEKGLVDIAIETNKPTEKIAKELIAFLQK